MQPVIASLFIVALGGSALASAEGTELARAVGMRWSKEHWKFHQTTLTRESYSVPLCMGIEYHTKYLLKRNDWLSTATVMRRLKKYDRGLVGRDKISLVSLDTVTFRRESETKMRPL